MACDTPITAYRSVSGSISFKRSDGDTIELPCGRCRGCLLERSLSWATRCVHEAQMHNDNCFVTLTYNDFHVKSDLVYQDFKDFIRRIRYEIGHVRYFVAGEYGPENGRPHFHAILFGVDFPDKVFFRNSPTGNKLYRSRVLEDLWRFGYSSVMDVTFDSAGYVARYALKKLDGVQYKVNTATGECRVPEFIRMSLRPGIGESWLKKFGSDVYPEGFVVVNGSKVRPPRYYDKKFKKRDELGFEDLQYRRYLRVQSKLHDLTPERLVVKAVVRDASMRRFKRVVN